MRFRLLFAALLAGALAVLAAAPTRAEDEDRIAVAVGAFDVFDDFTAGEMRVEYRWGRPLAWRLRPFVGVMGTADAAAYGYFGLGLDLGLSERVALTPNVAAGLYGDGSGKDLGHAVEFRSGLELSYRLDDGTRLGAAFHHTSNASLGDRNPGAESLVLTYSIPIARARGR